ncbi:MAG TPA: hypothetical protein VN421_06220 [Pseudoflavonifractor sp.]|nr:hypothetical protein [Pseudoflavonifractor sp.]
MQNKNDSQNAKNQNQNQSQNQSQNKARIPGGENKKKDRPQNKNDRPEQY